MAVNVEQLELLQTYLEAVNFLLRTYATDEDISEAVGNVTAFRQGSSSTEEVHSDPFWDITLRCGIVHYDACLKSLIVEGRPL